MDAERRKKLEDRGYKVYDHAGDAVGMTEAEKQEMDFRSELSTAIRKRREALGLTIKDLAKRLKVGVRQADKIEFGNFGVPLEQVLAAYSALGGRIGFKELPPYPANGHANGASAKPRKKKTTIG
jgi:ribosome-binding protein aMBF1 (putative translation factor)